MSLSEKLFTISNMTPNQEGLEKWARELSPQTLNDLKKTLDVVIYTWEVFASNPFGICTKNVPEFGFEKKGVSRDVATNLLQSIEQKVDVEILVDIDTVILGNDTITALKTLLLTVESAIGSSNNESKPKRAIEKDGKDNYFYDGKIMPFENKKALYYLIFKFLFNRASHEATYEEIDTHLSKCGRGSRETPAQMGERIRNAIKVYEKNKAYPQMIGEKAVFERISGGVRLNNPEI